MEKYTIISSLFDCGKFIDRYFENIFSQTIPPDEIILVDDGNNPLNLKEIIQKKKLFYNF